MSKLTLCVLAGVAIAAAAAVPSAAGGGGSDLTLRTGSAGPSTAAVAPVAVTAAAAQVAAKASTSTSKPLPRVLTLTRVVRLNLPTTGKVGTTVTGFIQVVDSNGQVESPVAGVEVALQRKATGETKWVDVADDLTDGEGQMAVSFTIKTNTSWRGALKPVSGKALYSKTVITTATAQLTWAARPDLDVTAGAAAPYAFRVTPASGSAHLEYATSPTATKWTAARAVTVKPDGVVRQSVTFPRAGTWYVRGATTSSTANAAGYTTALTVHVS